LYKTQEPVEPKQPGQFGARRSSTNACDSRHTGWARIRFIRTVPVDQWTAHPRPGPPPEKDSGTPSFRRRHLIAPSTLAHAADCADAERIVLARERGAPPINAEAHVRRLWAARPVSDRPAARALPAGSSPCRTSGTSSPNARDGVACRTRAKSNTWGLPDANRGRASPM
jgi:hypothetical protein